MNENFDDVTYGPITLERAKHHCKCLAVDCDWRASEVEQCLESQANRIVDLEEALEDKKQFQHFSNTVAAYDHLIANEIDQERIKLLECLRANWMEDNK